MICTRLGIFYWGYSTTTTYCAIANQSPLYDAVLSRIEYPFSFFSLAAQRVLHVVFESSALVGAVVTLIVS
jgi:hypothetical protein